MEIFLAAHPTIKQLVNFKISKNEVSLTDSWISEYLGNSNHEYFDLRETPSTIKQYSTRQRVKGYTIASFYFDEVSTNTERQVQNLTYAFSIIGGFMGIITMIMKVMIGWLQEQLFYSGIINEIYKSFDG
jgi:hypothetical protein